MSISGLAFRASYSALLGLGALPPGWPLVENQDPAGKQLEFLEAESNT